MRCGKPDQGFFRRTRPYAIAWLLAGLVPAVGAAAASRAAPRQAEQMSMQINDDRLTLQVAKVPQVYLYGVLDADAPNRFSALMKSWRIPPGSDVYLNISSGDPHAALALGRLFRSGRMVTHLGTPRPPSRSSNLPKTAVCADVCLYAYLGGLYRWAPTGNDRIGLPAPPAAERTAPAGAAAPLRQDERDGYLKELGIDAAALVPPPGTPRGETTWPSADQLLASGLSNNGRLPISAVNQTLGGIPNLVLSQVDRDGEHRLTILCRPDGLIFTAYDLVGAGHARQMLARGTRAYFEINRQELLPPQQEGAVAVNDSLMITHTFPLSQMPHLLSAHAMGAWLADRNSAFRYGFTMDMAPVKSTLRNYYVACWYKSQGASAP